MENEQTAPASKTETLIVRVRDLHFGDYLPLTKQTVIYSQQGARTPARKHEVALRRANGAEYATLWGSDTRIKVERAL